MTTTETPAMERIRVWDLPTRIAHWLLAGAFLVSFLTGDSEEWRMVHVTAGFALAGVLVFRLLWGFAGTRYARFASFLFTPRDVLAYLGGLLKRKPAHWVGHNPAGSYAIYALLLLGTAVAASGWAAYSDIGGETMEQAHDLLSDAMLAVVGLHLVGVITSGLLHRENLVRSMLNGYKRGRPEESIGICNGYGLPLLFGLVAGALLLALPG